MPGAPFLQVGDSYQGAPGLGMPEPTAGGAAVSHTAFMVWLVILGLVLPAIVLGGLKAGGFQFVFRRR